MAPKRVAVTGLEMPTAVLVDIHGPYRIVASGTATGLSHLGEGRGATIVFTLPEVAALIEAIPGEAVTPEILEKIRDVAKALREDS